jgi:hypothetical protein
MQQNLNFEKPEHTAQRLVQAVTDDLIAGSSQQSKNVDFLSYGDNAVRTSIVIDTILRNYYGTRDIGYWEDKQSWPGKPSLA